MSLPRHARNGSVRAVALAFVALLGLGACSSSHSSRALLPTRSVLTATTSTAPKTFAVTSTTARTSPRSIVVRNASWTLPAPLDREAAVTLGGDIVVMGGNRDGGTSRIVDAIDPRTGAARRLGLLASAAHDAAGALFDGRPTLIGGGAGVALDTVQVVEPDGTVTIAGHLPQPRADVASATATSARGATVIAGGYDGNAVTPDVLSTGDGTQFRVVARLPIGVRYPALALSRDGSTLYVIGGATSGGEDAGVDTNAVQAVSLRDGTATVVGHLAATRSHAAVAQLDGQIYLLGGHVNGAWSDDVAWFDPATVTLRVVAHLPREVSDAAATTVNGTVYLLGGERAPNAPVADVVELALTPR